MTRTGKYTEEGLDAAHQTFQETRKPKIYTFFKEAQASAGNLDLKALMSLQAFKDKLSGLGHFYTTCDGIEHLERQFKDQAGKDASREDAAAYTLA